ncbi:MAG: hypothetical protein OIN66_08200 [Candidatus Methanoperedens sp.]|nr:hypothetical protein [Candidatus Methanoperedens sp.]
MSQKRYLFLCLIVLLVVSGCVDKQQPQAEKVGWNQTRYEEYSAIYNSEGYTALYNNTDYIITPPTISFYNQSKAMDIRALLIEMPHDDSDFEKMWYSAFSYYLLSLDANVLSITNLVRRDMPYQETAQSRYWKQKSSDYYNKSLEYRQKIEEMKP